MDMPNLQNLPIDFSNVDWRYVAVLAVFVFFSTLIGTFRRAFLHALLSAFLFAAFFVIWTYYPHNLPLPTALSLDKSAAPPPQPDRVATQQQAYPVRSISMVVPFPAGGPSDVIARIVADQMAKVLGETIVIENVGGAGGTIGSARVAAANPDGYTLLAGSMGSHVAAPALSTNLRYDPGHGFEPIGLTAVAPVAIVARKDFPANNLREFISYVKANAGKVKQAHGGVGSSSHMACLLFTSQFGLRPELVPYRGTGPAVNDLAGGHVDFLCEQVVSVAPQVNSGLMKAYGVTGNTRASSLPNAPTMAEAGFPQFEMSIWSGLWAPRGTPKPVLAKLSEALERALEDPDLQKKISDLGGSVPLQAERSRAFFESYVNTEIARWNPILKAAGAAQTAGGPRSGL
jgi:putative tricarboxylic transport membrane protein